MKIVTKTKVFTTAAMLEVEVGTTGKRGGDSGHGGRTYLRFKDLASTDMRIEVNGAGLGNGEVTLIFGGDCELENLICGLEFALDVLKQSKQSGTAPTTERPTVGSRDVD